MCTFPARDQSAGSSSWTFLKHFVYTPPICSLCSAVNSAGRTERSVNASVTALVWLWQTLALIQRGDVQLQIFPPLMCSRGQQSSRFHSHSVLPHTRTADIRETKGSKEVNSAPVSRCARQPPHHLASTLCFRMPLVYPSSCLTGLDCCLGRAPPHYSAATQFVRSLVASTFL